MGGLNSGPFPGLTHPYKIQVKILGDKDKQTSGAWYLKRDLSLRRGPECRYGINTPTGVGGAAQSWESAALVKRELGSPQVQAWLCKHGYK